MRIALAIEHLDHRRGGGETYVHDFAAWLLAQGHQVEIVARDVHQPPDGATVAVIGARGASRTGRMTAFARAVRDHLRASRPDVSMATGKTLGMTVYQPHGGTVLGSQRQNARVRGSSLGRSLKRAFDALSPKHRAFRRLEAQQYADPQTHFVAISEMIRRDMQTFYGLPDERLSLVYNGIDLERFHPEQVRERRDDLRRQFEIPDAATAFLFVAHNWKLKGFREQIRALARLRSGTPADVRLLVVGRGRAGRWRKLARSLGIESNVIFAGPVADIRPLYGAADVLVLPTWYDPCSLVTLEALAAGLPVLTTRFNGVSELMDGRGAGVVLDAPRPVSRLADALGQLLDAGRRAEMSRAARALAEEHPQERNFREMFELLARAAGRA